jgi:rod shape-determining protein MreD
VTLGAALRIALLVFVVGILQVSAFSTISIAGGTPDVLLVTVVAVALVRGSVAGAVTGFAAGLLVDVATLATLGLTSLLFTLAGFWSGRYAETTGRARPHAPYLAITAATLFVVLGGWVLDALLGGSPSLGAALPGIPATVVWNLVVMLPMLALVRRVVGETDRVERGREVELLV